MKRLSCVLAVVVLLGVSATPADAGLFGPSKRELLQQLNAQAAMQHQTLVEIRVEQARQTELLRQLVGQGAALQNKIDVTAQGLFQRSNTEPSELPDDLKNRKPKPGNIPDNPFTDAVLPGARVRTISSPGPITIRPARLVYQKKHN